MNKLKGKKVIWVGDINVNQNKINDLDYRKLDYTLTSFNMVQTIQKYTRVAKKGNKFTFLGQITRISCEFTLVSIYNLLYL